MVKAVLLCPGQGAQRVGMGQDLAERFPSARDVFREVDDALDTKLSALMWNGPESDLTLTHNAQPAILAHSLAVWTVVRPALVPAAAAGHSLGEYSAYAMAGSLSLPDAARLVRRRGELMLEAGTRRPGTMAAVLGLSGDAVSDACRQASVDGSVAVAANLNAPDQTVISGDPAAVDRAAQRCKAAGAKRVLPLKVSGAFHSPLMQPAETGLQAALEGVTLAAPAFPIVANATADVVREPTTARRLLGIQLTVPVRWVACLQALDHEAGQTATFAELGPGTVLAGLAKRVVAGARTASLGTADEVSRLLEAA